MAISGPNHWLNPLEKFEFFKFLNFLFLHFPGLYCLGKNKLEIWPFFSIEIFPKGFTHGFGQKMAILPSCFFRLFSPGKFVLGYSRTKKRLFRL